MFNLNDALNRWILGKDILFFHGTSIECLEQILKQGSFAAPSHFSVVKSRLMPLLTEKEQRSAEECFDVPSVVTLTGAYTHSKFYSWSKAFIDYLMHKCGLSEVMDEFFETTECAGEDICIHEQLINDVGALKRGIRTKIITTAKKYGHKEDKVRYDINQALERKGAVLGIHRDFFAGKRLRDFSSDFCEMIYPYEFAKEPIPGLPAEFICSVYIPREAERREFAASYQKSNL